MIRRVLKSKFWIISIICLAFSLSSTGAFAISDDRDNHRGESKEYSRGNNSRWDNTQYDRRDNGPRRRIEKHYYRNGRWYKRNWLGFYVAVSALSVGAYVDSLPPRHTTIIVDNTPYYYDNSMYYSQRPYGGYIVVEEPYRRR